MLDSTLVMGRASSEQQADQQGRGPVTTGQVSAWSCRAGGIKKGHDHGSSDPPPC